MYITLYFDMLYWLAYFISFVHYAILHVYTGTHEVIERFNPTMCLLVDLNICCVYVESLLNICILLDIWLLVFIHIYMYSLLT